MAAVVLALNKIAFRYGVGTENLFKDLSLEIEAGESVCLLGANGSGKQRFKDFLRLVFPSAGNSRLWPGITEDLLEDSHFAQRFHRRIGLYFRTLTPSCLPAGSGTRSPSALQLGLSKVEVKNRVDDV